MELYENSESVQKLNTFWEQSKVEISNIKTDQITFKSQDLPLARIKKIMKLDEDVKSMMISAEAPILFAKAAEFFIREITLRAWIHTERNKRRTLQRSDITLAVADGDTDQFDFLIDIVPRDEIKTHGSTKREETTHNQPMHQIGGNVNLFGGNTIHLTSPGMTSNQQTLITSLVDSSNILQAQPTQNSAQSQPQVQYLLQLPSGTSLGGGQAIQIQVVPQQNMMASGGAGDNNVNTLTTSGAVLNGQQQHIFTLSNSQTNHGTTVVLPANMLSGTPQTQMYATTSSSTVNLDQHQVTVCNLNQQQQTGGLSSTVSTLTGVSTDVDGQSSGGVGNQFVISTIKRDMDEGGIPGNNSQEVI